MPDPVKRKQWMIDDPDLPQSIDTEDLLTRLPSGETVTGARAAAAVCLLPDA